MEAQQPKPIRLVCEQIVFCSRDVRFHLLLKYFSIRNSLSDVPSAPLFVDAISIFVAWAVEFQVGALAPEDFSDFLVSNLPLGGLTIRRSCVCCYVCTRKGLRFTDSTK